MAHYDCKNCGHTLGVSFGICENCTPKEYFDLQKEITLLREHALLAWDDGKEEFFDKYLEEHGISAIRNRLEEMRNDKRL